VYQLHQGTTVYLQIVLQCDNSKHQSHGLYIESYFSKFKSMNWCRAVIIVTLAVITDSFHEYEFDPLDYDAYDYDEYYDDFPGKWL